MYTPSKLSWVEWNWIELTKEWTAKDICFLYDPAKEIVYEAYNPYLMCPLLRIEDSKGDDSGNSSDSFIFPILISFWALLMEIALGGMAGLYKVHGDIDLLEEIDPIHYTGEAVKW